jgi:hypothetical protein
MRIQVSILFKILEDRSVLETELKQTIAIDRVKELGLSVDLGVLGTVLSEGGVLGIRGRSRDYRPSRY